MNGTSLVMYYLILRTHYIGRVLSDKNFIYHSTCSLNLWMSFHFTNIMVRKSLNHIMFGWIFDDINNFRLISYKLQRELYEIICNGVQLLTKTVVTLNEYILLRRYNYPFYFVIKFNRSQANNLSDNAPSVKGDRQLYHYLSSKKRLTF